ncbi:MAG: caspase family protein [Armatimonadetes bacterium]|nr:caspase family protein [Armatimonadota bacterium]
MKAILTLTLIILVNITIWGQSETITATVYNRYALVIGVSSYEESSNDLRYAKKDASDFQDALLKFGRFNKDNIKLLMDKDATRENIRKNLEGWLKTKAKKNDLAIIFFSGHGTQVIDTDGDEDDGLDECLLPYDFDNEDYSTVIIDDVFAYWIKNLQSEKVLIIFDNCYSGGAAKQKGVSLKGVKGNIGKDDFTKDIVREVPRKGTALFSASKADQVSFESKEFQNGIFTHFLLKSISSISDNNFNNIINLNELYYSTRQKTLEYTKDKFKKEQEPTLINLIENDLDIFYLPVSEKEITDSKEIEALMYKVRNEKSIAKKIEMLEEIYYSDPNNYRINSELAEIYESKNEYLKAIEHYQNIISIKNEKEVFILSLWLPPIDVRFAKLYMKLGQTDLAMLYYSKAIEKKPSNASTYNEIAQAYLSNKDTLTAVQLLNISINMTPYQIEPYLTLFYIHMANEDYEVSFDIINKSYLINPFDFETLYWYAMKEKFFNHKLIGDSLLLSFKEKCGINKSWTEINKTYSSNLRFLNQETEYQLLVIKNTINNYPYYDEFYKYLIKFVKDNNLSENLDGYIKKYLLYSKLNPDHTFIENYIK